MNCKFEVRISKSETNSKFECSKHTHGKKIVGKVRPAGKQDSKKQNMNKSSGQTGEYKYDLEERTFDFAHHVRHFVKQLPKSIRNIEDVKQLIRSSGSVGANYIEANEALSKKDFILRIKISRTEAKESRYWLRLLDTNNSEELEKQRAALIQEAQELTNIFGSILRKSESSSKT